MKKTKVVTAKTIDKVNYDYLVNKPKSEQTLIDFMAISTLEEKYPEFKS